MAETFAFGVPYGALAGGVLALHLLWILWVMFGALVTRRHLLLAGFHILSLIYGIVIEIAPWPCPLTLLEQWLEVHAGVTPYTGGFLVHYLDSVVYPDVSEGVLIAGAVVVAACNLAIYARRFWHTREKHARA